MFYDVLNWCFKNWQFCLSVLFFLFSLFFMIFKKRPTWNQMATIFVDVFQKLPLWINVVEQGNYSGSEKLLIVLNLVRTYLHKFHKFDNFEEIESVIKEQIETILSTPQKKEVNVCEIEKENPQL